MSKSWTVGNCITKNFCNRTIVIKNEAIFEITNERLICWFECVPLSTLSAKLNLTCTVDMSFVTLEAVKRTRMFLYWFLSTMPSSVAFTGINTSDDHVILYVHGLECGTYVPNTAWLMGTCERIHVLSHPEMYRSNSVIVLIFFYSSQLSENEG